MKTLDIIRRAGRSLRNAKGRTILTSLAIAVGAFTLTLSLAAGEGARQYADKLISSNVDPQSIFIAKDGTLFGEGGAPGSGGGLREYSTNQTAFGGATFKALDRKDINIIKQTPNVESVSITYLVQAQYVTFQGNDTKFTSDIASYDASVRSDVAAGALPAIGTQIDDDGVIVPEGYLKSLGDPSPQSLIGKTVTLRLAKSATQPTQAEIEKVLLSEGPAALQKKFAPETRDVKLKIAAISAKSSTALSASNALFISENKARELSEYLTKGTDQYQKYLTATARVKDGVDPAVVKDSFAEQFKNAGRTEGVAARTARDLQGLLFTIVNTLQGIVIGFGVIALIASVFGIINTQYISVLERTREIGLMKSLGMRGWSVSKLFMFEAAWIGLLGGILGSAGAWALGSSLNPWITDMLDLGDGNYLLIFQIVPILMLILTLIVIAILAGLFPAVKAARLDPIEALRTE